MATAILDAEVSDDELNLIIIVDPELKLADKNRSNNSMSVSGTSLGIKPGDGQIGLGDFVGDIWGHHT